MIEIIDMEAVTLPSWWAMQEAEHPKCSLTLSRITAPVLFMQLFKQTIQKFADLCETLL